MQLVIYLKVLLEKYKKEGKDAEVAGIFLSKINSNLKNDEEYSLEDNKLTGLVSSNELIQMKMDKNYKASKILPLSYTKSGALDAKSQKKVYGKENFDELVNVCIDKTKVIAEDILDGKMSKTNEDNDYCMFCPYKNVCTSCE